MAKFHSFASASLPLLIFCLSTLISAGDISASITATSSLKTSSISIASTTTLKSRGAFITQFPFLNPHNPTLYDPEAPHAIVIETGGLLPITPDGPAIHITTPPVVAVSPETTAAPNTAGIPNPIPPVVVPSPNVPPPQPISNLPSPQPSDSNNPQPVNGPSPNEPAPNGLPPVNIPVIDIPSVDIIEIPALSLPEDPSPFSVMPVVDSPSPSNNPPQTNPDGIILPFPDAIAHVDAPITDNQATGNNQLPSNIQIPESIPAASKPASVNNPPPPNNIQSIQENPSVPIAVGTYDPNIISPVIGETIAPPAFILPGGSTLQPGQIYTAPPNIAGGNSIVISLAPVPINAAQDGVPNSHNLVISTLNAGSRTTITLQNIPNPKDPGAIPAITSFPVAKTIVYNSQTLVMGGPIATLADKNAVASYGPQGVVIQYPGGSVSSIPFRVNQAKTTSGAVSGNTSSFMGTLMTSIVSSGSVSSNSTAVQSVTRTSIAIQVTERPSGSPSSEGRVTGVASGKATPTNGCGGTGVGGLKWALVPVLALASFL